MCLIFILNLYLWLYIVLNIEVEATLEPSRSSKGNDLSSVNHLVSNSLVASQGQDIINVCAN